jgi:hypothetical protein
MTPTNSLSISATGTTSATIQLNIWEDPIFIKAQEVGDSIEILYKQQSRITYNYTGEIPSRVFKIVYSCKKGKWHKSEPVYGIIIPASEEIYEFNT